MTLRARIVNAVGTNTAMIKLLREKKRVFCNKVEFSTAIHYKTNAPKDFAIREAVFEILEELERK